jgi:bifunctional non-homologous end joining protein LigD
MDALMATHSRWLKPALVGQFEFVEWTPENNLRYSKFVALRDDKKATDVQQELPHPAS